MDLTDANLESCKLFWTDFSDAKLIRTKMSFVKLTWSKLNNAYFENTDLRDADLSWTVCFDSNLKAQSKLDSANLYMIALSLGDIKQRGLEMAKEKLEQLRSSLPPEIWRILKKSIEDTKATEEIVTNLARVVGEYKEKEHIPESQHGDDYSGDTKEYVPSGLGPYKNKEKYE